MPPAPRVSLVLPCFNEGHRIVSSLQTLESWFGRDLEIVVMDDGSGDDTRGKVEQYARDRGHVRIHSLPHRGKGAAVRSAIPLVRGELVAFMDADLAFDRESIQRALDALAAADIAVGNRRHPESRYSVPVRVFGFLYGRHLSGLLFNAFVRLVVGVAQRDTQCGLKAFRRATLERLMPVLTVDGFALDVEMLLVARALRVRVAEVPVNVHYESAKTSVRLIGSGRAMMSDIVRIALRRMRGAYAPARLQALAAPSASTSTR